MSDVLCSLDCHTSYQSFALVKQSFRVGPLSAEAGQLRCGLNAVEIMILFIVNEHAVLQAIYLQKRAAGDK